MSRLVYESSFTHHGVKGMKWGVRRYQNPDGTLTKAGRARSKGARVKQKLSRTYLGKEVSKNSVDTAHPVPVNDQIWRKGSSVNHITPLDFRQLRPGQDLFVSADEFDKNLYRTFLSTKMMSKGFSMPIKEVEFVLKRDLKAPSDFEQRKIYEHVRSQNPKMFDRDMQTRFHKHEYSYNDFVKSLDKTSSSKTAFVAELRKAGYNAILDVHDITDSWMQAKTPLIVIDALDSLGDIKVRDLQQTDLLRSLDYILKNNKR